jgi:hypothetical protein
MMWAGAPIYKARHQNPLTNPPPPGGGGLLQCDSLKVAYPPENVSILFFSYTRRGYIALAHQRIPQIDEPADSRWALY